MYDGDEEFHYRIKMFAIHVEAVANSVVKHCTVLYLVGFYEIFVVD
jgi:hypothetical protein